MTAGEALGVGLCVGGTRALNAPLFPWCPKCVCLSGSVSVSPGGWALFMGVPLGLGLYVWVSVCFSIFL